MSFSGFSGVIDIRKEVMIVLWWSSLVVRG